MVMTKSLKRKQSDEPCIRKHVPDEKKSKHNIPKDEEEQAIIKDGDTVNLSDLLFTKKRDYLIKYKDNQLVKHKQLAGKVIVLYFVSLVNGYKKYLDKSTTNLVDIYNNLEPKGGFEVVFVAVRDDMPCRDTGESMSTYSTPHERYEERFSTMSWTAIPFSDLKSRKRLERIFGIFSSVDMVPVSFVIDPRGVVVQSCTFDLFSRYGAAGYPFTNERLKSLDSEDDMAGVKLSISTLLASRERDYVITNKGDQVPLHKLEDKVVGLFFLTDIYLDECITWKLKKAYEELSKNKEDFEVVLIPILSKNAFLKTFEAMPWLAIPYKDRNCIKKLRRIFKYPLFEPGRTCVSRLVIVEPHGKFIEPFGAHIFMCYGIPAYPFTRFSAAKSKLESAKDVKPEMFWDLDAVFTQKNGSQVRFSQIVGKRIIVLFQIWYDILEDTLRKLKALYIQMKGTNDEFEVIHICEEGESKHVAATIPWLMHPPFDEASDANQLMCRLFYGSCDGIIAFDCDGRVVRMTSVPVVGKMVFPFYGAYGADGMEDEVFLEVKDIFDEPLEAFLRCW